MSISRIQKPRIHNRRDVQVIWRQVPKTVGPGHFGNRIRFSLDGKLFITSGERMRFDPAQSLESNLGKVVRINKDGSIPDDNPFVGKTGARCDIGSHGHRNVLSAAFDSSLKLVNDPTKLPVYVPLQGWTTPHWSDDGDLSHH